MAKIFFLLLLVAVARGDFEEVKDEKEKEIDKKNVREVFIPSLGYHVPNIESFYGAAINHTFFPFFWRRMNSLYNIWKDKNTWEEYKTGFADANNYWMGLEKLYKLTSKGKWYMVMKMKWWKNALTGLDDPKKGEWGVAVFTYFQVFNQANKYQWSFHKPGHTHNFHSDQPCNILGFENDMRFTTADRDYDKNKDKNCAKDMMGWWYNDCYGTNVFNGIIVEGGIEDDKCTLPIQKFHVSEIMMAIYRDKDNI